MISGGELRKGIIIELDGMLYQVVDYQHVKMKRTALARVKLRDLSAGHTTERSFQSNDKLVRAHLDSRPMQYLYNDGGLYHFMDVESFEQIEINRDRLGDVLNYLKEGFTVEVSSYKGEVVDIELPVAVELEVAATEPGFKGDTATGGSKPATLETGLTLQVPLFVNQGDVIKVDTRTGEYLERSN
jgi:elongation factor P